MSQVRSPLKSRATNALGEPDSTHDAQNTTPSATQACPSLNPKRRHGAAVTSKVRSLPTCSLGEVLSSEGEQMTSTQSTIQSAGMPIQPLKPSSTLSLSSADGAAVDATPSTSSLGSPSSSASVRTSPKGSTDYKVELSSSTAQNVIGIREAMMNIDKTELSRLAGLSMEFVSPNNRPRGEEKQQQSHLTRDHLINSDGEENEDPRFKVPHVQRSPTRFREAILAVPSSIDNESAQESSFVTESLDGSTTLSRKDAPQEPPPNAPEIPARLEVPASPLSRASSPTVELPSELDIPKTPPHRPKHLTQFANHHFAAYGISDASVLSPGTAAALAVAQAADAAENTLADYDYDYPRESSLKFKTPPRSLSSKYQSRYMSPSSMGDVASDSQPESFLSLQSQGTVSDNAKALESMIEDEAKTLKSMYASLRLPDSGEEMAAMALEEILSDISRSIRIGLHLACIHEVFYNELEVDVVENTKHCKDFECRNSMLESSHTFILQKALPRITRELLNRNLSWSYENKARESMQTFLQHTLNLIILLIRNGDQTLCNTLTRIFDGSRQFYIDASLDEAPPSESHSGMSSHIRISDTMGRSSEVIHTYAYMSSSMVSRHLVQNVNHFGIHGGFDALLQLVHVASHKKGTSPAEMAMIFEPLVRIRSIMIAVVLKRVIETCADSAKHWLSKIGPKECNDWKLNDVLTVSSQIEFLLEEASARDIHIGHQPSKTSRTESNESNEEPLSHSAELMKNNDSSDSSVLSAHGYSTLESVSEGNLSMQVVDGIQLPTAERFLRHGKLDQRIAALGAIIEKVECCVKREYSSSASQSQLEPASQSPGQIYGKRIHAGVSPPRTQRKINELLNDTYMEDVVSPSPRRRRNEIAPASKHIFPLTSTSTLISWMQRIDIVSYIFGPHSHLEILKRCPKILTFLSHHGALGEKDLLVIWSATQGKHEADTNAVFDCIKEAGRNGLDRRNVDTLLDLAREHLASRSNMNSHVPILEVVEELMDSQGDLLLELNRHKGNDKVILEVMSIFQKAVEILWEQYCISPSLTSNESNIDVEKRYICKRALLYTCFSPVGIMHSLPKRIVKLSFNKISTRQSPFLALEMLKDLIEACSGPIDKSNTKADEVALFRSNRRMVERILADIDMNGFGPKLESQPHVPGVLDTIVSLLVDPTYYSNTGISRWQCLLNVISFLATESSSSTLITLKLVQDIWQAFVQPKKKQAYAKSDATKLEKEYAIAETHLTHVMQFLCIVITDGTISVEACKYVFQRYHTGDVPFRQFTLFQYDCFFKLYQLAERSHFSGAAGLETFWKIAVLAKTDRVWQSAAQYICKKHLHNENLRILFVEKCLDCMISPWDNEFEKFGEDSCNSNLKTRLDALQKRCITLLVNFNEHTVQSNYTDATTPGINVKDGLSIEEPDSIVRLPSFGSCVSPDKPEQDPMGSSLVCMSTCFEILSRIQEIERFMLFLKPPTSLSVSSQVWELLQLLPIDRAFQKQVRDCLHKGRLVNLPHGESLYSNMYHVHILHHIAEIDTSNMSNGKPSENHSATTQFLKQGGVESIAQTINTSLKFISSVQHHHELRCAEHFHCLECSSSLICTLISKYRTLDSFKEDVSVPLKALKHNILSILPGLDIHNSLLVNGPATVKGVSCVLRLMLAIAFLFEDRSDAEESETVLTLANALSPFLLYSLNESDVDVLGLKESVYEMHASISDYIKSTFNVAPSLTMSNILLSLMDRVDEFNCFNYFQLFAFIVESTCKRIPSGKQCRLVSLISLTTLEHINWQALDSSETVQNLRLNFLAHVLASDNNKLGYRIPCDEPSKLGQLINNTILDNWLLPQAINESEDKCATATAAARTFKMASTRRSAYSLIRILLKKGLRQFSAGSFMKCILLPVLKHFQSKHAHMEFEILGTSAASEQKEKDDIESAMQVITNSGHMRKAKAYGLKMSKERLLESSRRRSQLNQMQGEIASRSGGFVGLRNLGSICYMNSCLQQLFMNLEFREGIFNIPALSVSCTADTCRQSESSAENPLLQLKYLFSFLQSSERRYHNPQDFCLSVKDSEGRSTNVCVQQDADEFIRLLFDQLESCEKEVSAASKQSKGSQSIKELIKSCFGGEVVNQIICKDGVDYVSERVEAFTSLTIEIKGKSSIEDSLNLFVKGEVLEGDNAYFCDQIDPPRKVTAVKRTCIRSPPKHLILHLKRFEFDFATMRKYKVNDYCSFGMTLNLFPFMETGVSQQGMPSNKPLHLTNNENNFIYKLTGVVVHVGNADAGHYYSLIRKHDNSDDECAESRKVCNDEGEWFIFNDESVEVFDPKQMPHICFGGPINRTDGRQDGLKCHNAYMLLYKKVKKVQSSLDMSQTDRKTDKQSNELLQENIVLSQAVEVDNLVRRRACHFFDVNFADLLLETIRMTVFSELKKELPFGFIREQVMPFALRVFLTNVAPTAVSRSQLGFGYDNINLKEESCELRETKWLTLITDLATSSPDATLWLLEYFNSRDSIILEMIITGSDDETRLSMAILVQRLVQFADLYVDSIQNDLCATGDNGVSTREDLEGIETQGGFNEREKSEGTPLNIPLQKVANSNFAQKLQHQTQLLFRRLARVLNSYKRGTARLADFSGYFELVLNLVEGAKGAVEEFHKLNFAHDLIDHFLADVPSSNAIHSHLYISWRNLFRVLHHLVCKYPTRNMIHSRNLSPTCLNLSDYDNLLETAGIRDVTICSSDEKKCEGVYEGKSASLANTLEITDTLSMYTGSALSNTNCVSHLLIWHCFCDEQLSKLNLKVGRSNTGTNKETGCTSAEEGVNEDTTKDLLLESDYRIPIKILAHICWESLAISEDVIKGITAEIRFSTLSQTRALLKLAYELIECIEDKWIEDRRKATFDVDRGIMSSAIVMSRRSGSPGFFNLAEKKVVEILHCFSIALADDPSLKFMQSHTLTIQWALSWLHDMSLRLQSCSGPTTRNYTGAGASKSDDSSLEQKDCQDDCQDDAASDSWRSELASSVLQIEKRLSLMLGLHLEEPQPQDQALAGSNPSSGNSLEAAGIRSP